MQGMAAEKAKKVTITPTSKRSYTWQRIYDLVVEHKPELIKANIIAFFAMLVTVPLPLLIPILVDEVLLEKPGAIVGFLQTLVDEAWHGPVYYVAAITLATMLLRIAGLGFGVWQTQQFTVIAKNVTYRIRKDLLARVQNVSMAQYSSLGSGTVSATMLNDVNTIDTFLGSSVSKLIVSMFSLIGVSAVLFWLNWQLALLIIMFNPVVVYFTMLMGRRVKTLKKDENTAVDAFQQSLTETLDALQQVRAANQDKSFFNRVRGYAYNIKTHSEAFTWKSDAASRFSFTIFLMGFDLFRGAGMLMVVFSDLSVGQMIAVFGYLWYMLGPVQELLTIQYGFNAASGALQRINEVLDLNQEPQYQEKTNPFKGQKAVSIKVRDLAFHYPDKEEMVLKKLNFTLPAGEKLALVGASGGGKTTLVQILLGFYEPTGGQVYFNGIPITQIGQAVVRANVATVLQQPALFNQTIRFNLTLGRDLPDEALWEALEQAQIADTVRQQNQQLDAMVGREGVKLSGGQRQRLAIARMILQDPKVVIMDEASSALDMETERQLYLDLAPFLAERTTLIVAHRLSSIRQADKIMVFEDGHIVETGSHDELMAQAGTYHKLYR